MKHLAVVCALGACCVISVASSAGAEPTASAEPESPADGSDEVPAANEGTHAAANEGADADVGEADSSRGGKIEGPAVTDPHQKKTEAEPDEARRARAAALHQAMRADLTDASGPDEPVDAGPQIVIHGPLASAPAISLSQAESGSWDVAAKGHTHIVLPSEHVEVGGEVAFITSQPQLTEEETRFSDVGLLRLRARRSFAERVEGYLHTQLLIKQPSSTDEPLWQSGGLGVRAEVLERFALVVGGSGGLMLGNNGLWWQAAPGVLFKPEVSRLLRFVLGAGGLFTMLHFSETSAEPFWIQEVTAKAEAQIGDRNSVMWVALNYAIPVASSPDSERPDPTRGALDPQVRLGVDVGGALSLDRSDWDVYAILSVIDRGDLEVPETTLPILDGGFDQQQIIIGFQHRFGE